MNGLFIFPNILIATILGLAIFILWTRFSIMYFNASKKNSLAISLIHLSDKLLIPAHFVMRESKVLNKMIDWPALFTIVALELIKSSAKLLFIPKVVMPMKWIAVVAFTDFIATPLDFLFYAVLLQVLIGYFKPNSMHPAHELLKLVTNPLLRLGQQMVPNISGFDFSPIIVLTILKALNIYIHSTATLYFL